MAQAVERAGIARRAAGNYFVQIVIVFVAYLVAGKLGQATTNIRSSNLGPVWPAYGIALAAVLFWRSRIWVGIAAAAFLSPPNQLRCEGLPATTAARRDPGL